MDALIALLILGSTPKPITHPVVDTQQKNCLAANIYFEARGESLQGQKAVAAVTLNRVKSKKYPKTVCAVVTQKSQFSWVQQQPKHVVQKALNGVAPSQKPLEVLAYQEAQKLAYIMIKAKEQVLPEQALWYHTTQINPAWNKQMIKIQVVGSHVFYKHKQEGRT